MPELSISYHGKIRITSYGDIYLGDHRLDDVIRDSMNFDSLERSEYSEKEIMGDFRIKIEDKSEPISITNTFVEGQS